MTPPTCSPWMRILMLVLGWIALIAGIIGAFLPVMPTTPFVLLAAACFARGSPRLHQKMLEHRLFGPLIREWETHRTIPIRAKRLAQVMMLVSFSSSVYLMAGRPWIQLGLVVLGIVLMIVVERIPSRAHH